MCESARERKDIVRSCESPSQKRLGIVLLIYNIVFTLALFGSVIALRGKWQALKEFSFVMVAMSTAMVVLWPIQMKKLHPKIRIELRRRGYLVCLNCGYDLRGTTEHRCPECGTATNFDK